MAASGVVSSPFVLVEDDVDAWRRCCWVGRRAEGPGTVRWVWGAVRVGERGDEGGRWRGEDDDEGDAAAGTK